MTLLAASKTTATATITVDNPTPTQGDFITFSVTTDGAPTGVRVVITHAGGQSFSSVEWQNTPGSYTKRVGLYAPNWPDNTGGSCVADVVLIVRSNRSGRTVTQVLASVIVPIAP